ncbi:MAG TPA: Na+/H+ antiporter subunit E [Marmoricola sp.]|nr:Na+/H+ antiporter subunit E [Marmoricola sp.]
MSPVTRERADGSVRPSRYRALQPTSLVWLTVVWVALWGDISVANILSGAALAVIVSLVFPLPPLHMNLRVRPVRLLWLVLRFLLDVVVASCDVAWKILTLRGAPRNAVIEVNLRTPSDFVLTVVGELTSLVPGSVVVEARRSSHTLFLHVLDARDEAGAERMRKATYALERRVVLAFGAETWHVDTGPTEEST